MLVTSHLQRDLTWPFLLLSVLSGRMVTVSLQVLLISPASRIYLDLFVEPEFVRITCTDSSVII